MYKTLGMTALFVLGLCGGAPAASNYQEAAAIDPQVLSVLPEDEGREATARVCSQCHSIGMVISQKHDQDGWNEVIGRMIDDQGLYAPDEELMEISAYLARNFNPNPPAAGS